MHLTKWLEGDGYFECFASFTKTCGPCLKVRVVKTGDKEYQAVLRSHQNGEMVASFTYEQNVEVAKKLAVQLLKDFLIKEGDRLRTSS
jgi:hypothetical protein